MPASSETSMDVQSETTLALSQDPTTALMSIIMKVPDSINANDPQVQDFPTAPVTIEEVSESASVIDPEQSQSTSSASDIPTLDEG